MKGRLCELYSSRKISCYNTLWTDHVQQSCFDVFNVSCCDYSLSTFYKLRAVTCQLISCNRVDATGRQQSLCTHHPVIAHLFGVKHGVFLLSPSYFLYSHLKAKSSGDQSLPINQHHADKSLGGAKKILYLKHCFT